MYYIKIIMNETISLIVGTNLLLVVIITFLDLLFVLSINVLGIGLGKVKKESS